MSQRDHEKNESIHLALRSQTVKSPLVTRENTQLQSHENGGRQEGAVSRLLEGTRMMGKKERSFALLIHVSLLSFCGSLNRVLERIRPR